jgi:N-acetylmuramoyl-L-alanine amidase
MSLFGAPTAPATGAAPAQPTAGNGQPTAIASRTLLPTAVATASVVLLVTASPTVDAQHPLTGRRIAIDPGHGPRGDLGAVSVDPNTGKLILSEADFTLDVAQRCRDILVARGASVVLTRENADTFTSSWPNDANGDGIEGASGDDLQTRVDIFNDFHADVFLSIHANSIAESKSAEDLQVIYCGSDCAFPAQNKHLGDLVLSALTRTLAAVDVNVQGGAVLDDLAVDSSDPPLHMFILGPPNPPRHMRSPNMPGVLGETFYVSKPAEVEELLRDDVRQAIALGYADALQQYLLDTPSR